jgi:hypothetical protein
MGRLGTPAMDRWVRRAVIAIVAVIAGSLGRRLTCVIIILSLLLEGRIFGRRLLQFCGVLTGAIALIRRRQPAKSAQFELK